MFSLSSQSRPKIWFAGLVLGLTASGTVLAQNNSAAGTAPAATATPATPSAPTLPPRDPAAEKALEQHFQSIFAALQGQSALPDTKNFTDDFNQQVNATQLKQVLGQVHQTVGNCRVAGQLKSPVSFVSGYLLQCDKGFVPMDIAIEDKAPYRVHSLLIRPGYSKL